VRAMERQLGGLGEEKRETERHVPVTGVPPVGVEVAVGKAGDFGEGAEDVFEDDEEDEEQGDHEGEEEHADALGEDEARFGEAFDAFQPQSRLVQDGHDELFAGDHQQEDAAEDG